MLVGVSTALYTFSAFATVVVEGGWSRYVERWRDTRMINNLSDHYVVCGFGRIGSIVASELKRPLAGRPLSAAMPRPATLKDLERAAK